MSAIDLARGWLSVALAAPRYGVAFYIGSPTASPYLRPSRAKCVRVWVGGSADLLPILAGGSVCVCVCVWGLCLSNGGLAPV